MQIWVNVSWSEKFELLSPLALKVDFFILKHRVLLHKKQWRVHLRASAPVWMAFMIL